MSSPLMVMRLRIDGQGRMVLPKWLRRELGADPGEVEMRRTAEGVLLTPVTPLAQVEVGGDGLPVMRLGRPVSNEEVLAAIDKERSRQ